MGRSRSMDIITALRLSGRPVDDEELAGVLGVDRRAVIRECRRLAFQGRLIREQGQGGVIFNRLDTAIAGDGRVWSGDLR